MDYKHTELQWFKQSTSSSPSTSVLVVQPKIVLRLNLKHVKAPDFPEISPIKAASVPNQQFKENQPLSGIAALASKRPTCPSDISYMSNNTSYLQHHGSQQLEVKKQPTIDFIKQMKRRAPDADMLSNRNPSKSIIQQTTTVQQDTQESAKMLTCQSNDISAIQGQASLQQLNTKKQPTIDFIKQMKKRTADTEIATRRNSSQSLAYNFLSTPHDTSANIPRMFEDINQSLQTPAISKPKQLKSKSPKPKAEPVAKTQEATAPPPLRKGITMEINFDTQTDNTKSLADRFRDRYRTNVQDQTSCRDPPRQRSPVSASMTVNVNRRSREEQIKLRREMMNYGRSVRDMRSPPTENKAQPNRVQSPLMERLVKGEKAKVPKQEMYALTKKNYENLPEVKKRKCDEQRKRDKDEFLKDRKNKIKEMEREIRNRLFKKGQ